MSMDNIFIIAEAGINHNGDFDNAVKMVELAAIAGADAVKFQTFKAKQLMIPNAPKAQYQQQAIGDEESMLDMACRLELSYPEFLELHSHCRDRGIEFLSTPFDFESITFLADLGLETFKIPSGEVTNLPHLRKIGALNRNVILSTGMADMLEIKQALEVIIGAGTDKDKITILHCNTDYPTPMEDVNLSAMLSIKKALGVKVGYSDHTLGIEIPVAVAALGASVIEKHFTLDKSMPGPDHRASLSPEELKEMVKAVRNIEKALGDGVKRTSPSEAKNMYVARRSIVAARDINKGEIFSEENISAKRPSTGMSPMLWDSVIGMVASRDFKKDSFIKL